MIDHMASDGWLEAGYQYVSIDDCWMAVTRDENNDLAANAERFPHGIAWLADYAHQRGVKLGIYNDYGTFTCASYPGSEGHLKRDARTFAKWKVDMLKMDGCSSTNVDKADAYPAMAHFLNKTGRPILYECSWPAYDKDMDYSELPESCNMWRNWGDIRANWETLREITNVWGEHSNWGKYAGPGHWNDPDQLLIGISPRSWAVGYTPAESRTQMGIWSILGAPLFMSNDLRSIPEFARNILQNKEVISVDQDELGKAGRRITPSENDGSIWVKELSRGEYAVALFNRGEVKRDIVVKFSLFCTTRKFAIRDLWAHRDLGVYQDEFATVGVEPHDTIMIRLTPT
jgi:alpha-N-acetylgalactosaminidase